MYFVCSNVLYSASLYLECLFLFWLILTLDIVIIGVKSQPGVAYKSIFLKKAHNIAFQSSKNEEITFPHEFIFVYPALPRCDIVKKVLPKARGSEKRQNGGWGRGGGGL